MTTQGDILERLDGHAGREMTIDELVRIAEELLRELAPRQTRYKVSERPDVRTIRYYTNQGLLPAPIGYQGGRARYSVQHLTRLLLIKKLQAEHYTLHKIKQLLSEADDQRVRRGLCASLPEKPSESSPAPAAAVVKPAEPLAPAPRSPERITRFELAHGSALDIPQSVFEDTERLRGLAEDLVTIARQLGYSALGGQEGSPS